MYRAKMYNNAPDSERTARKYITIHLIRNVQYCKDCNLWHENFKCVLFRSTNLALWHSLVMLCNCGNRSHHHKPQPEAQFYESQFYINVTVCSRSRWPHGLRRVWSCTSWTMGLWVRMYVCMYVRTYVSSSSTDSSSSGFLLKWSVLEKSIFYMQGCDITRVLINSYFILVTMCILH